VVVDVDLVVVVVAVAWSKADGVEDAGRWWHSS